MATNSDQNTSHSSDEEDLSDEQIASLIIQRFLEAFELQLGGFIPEAEIIAPPTARNPPPETEEEYRAYVSDFIMKNVSAFYEPDDPEVEALIVRAASKAKEMTATYKLSAEVTPELVKLALYDFVILCDDSGSMKHGERISALKDTLQHVAEIATCLEPSGISVRFLNHKQDTGFNNLTDLRDIENMIDSVNFRGGTQLGRALESKIIQPMVIQKAKDESFKKPLITIVITDGEPTFEPLRTFQDNILNCKRSQVFQKYGPAAAVFIISRVGDSADAEIFLTGLRNDRELAEMVFCSMDRLDDQLAVFQKSGDDIEYTRFVSILPWFAY
ncbi:MAG: hypothetical protein M1813_000955 [Trichoglossum hirsutum]|nr:MAG: hypothetical protein M1813_000955 [Trichoglossum hirsutum]